MLNFPTILSENEETYFRYLEGVVGSVDTDASIQVINRSEGISVRISPGSMQNFQIILQEVKKFHTLLGIRVSFSKSMKAGNNIHYTINQSYGDSKTGEDAVQTPV
jgi:hypothetical protein